MGHTIPHDDRDERAQALDREVDDFFASGARLTKGFIRWLASLGNRAGAVEIATTRPSQGDDVELLTTAELARRIGYSPRRIQTFKLEGMPFIGEGRSTRFELNKVIEWLKQRPRAHHKNNRVSMAGNGKVPQAPIKTRLQASQRR